MTSQSTTGAVTGEPAAADEGVSLADVVDAVRRVRPDVPRRQAALLARHYRRESDLLAARTDAQLIAARVIERLRRGSAVP